MTSVAKDRRASAAVAGGKRGIPLGTGRLPQFNPISLAARLATATSGQLCRVVCCADELHRSALTRHGANAMRSSNCIVFTRMYDGCFIARSRPCREAYGPARRDGTGDSVAQADRCRVGAAGLSSTRADLRQSRHRAPCRGARSALEKVCFFGRRPAGRRKPGSTPDAAPRTSSSFVTLRTREHRVVGQSTNVAMTPERYAALKADFLAAMGAKDKLYVADLFGGSQADHRVDVRVVTEFAWHSLFVRTLLVRPSAAELATFAPEYTIVDLPRLLRRSRAPPAAAAKPWLRSIFTEKTDPDRRHSLCRRNEEVGFQPLSIICCR